MISKETDTKNDKIQHRIDTKGIVIFTLKTGGTIRDAGSEIHFSAHDKTARDLAHKLAIIKWGRQAVAEDNTIKLAGKALERGASR